MPKIMKLAVGSIDKVIAVAVIIRIFIGPPCIHRNIIIRLKYNDKIDFSYVL